MKIKEKLKIKYKEIKRLENQIKQNNKRIRSRWKDKFVDMQRYGININPIPRELGIKELSKYNIEYLQESLNESKEMFWENPGISYTPKKCFCMICGSTNTDAWIQYGICPRFATCPKHVDFLMLGFHLKKIK